MNKIIHGDSYEVLKTLNSETVDCIITSPPYYQLRDYGYQEQIGLEPSLHEYISKLALVFNECKRVLKKDGTMFIVIGDTYSGNKNGKTDLKLQYIKNQNIKKRTNDMASKNLMQIPSRLSIGLQDEGWILRNEIIWHKPNAMPQSVKDRFTIDYEKIFFFVKSKNYYFKQLQEKMKTLDITSPRGSKGAMHQLNKGLRLARERNRSVSSKNTIDINLDKEEKYVNEYLRNKRSVWSISTESKSTKHYATFPEELVELLLEAGCKPNGVVLDPFNGSGTTTALAKYLGYGYIGIDGSKEYCELATKRLEATPVQIDMFGDKL